MASTSDPQREIIPPLRPMSAPPPPTMPLSDTVPESEADVGVDVQQPGQQDQPQQRRRRRSSLDATACIEVGEKVRDRFDQFLTETQLARNDSRGSGASTFDNIRTFRMDEIVVGRLLGSGSFNDVYEAFPRPRYTHSNDLIGGDISSRQLGMFLDRRPANVDDDEEKSNEEAAAAATSYTPSASTPSDNQWRRRHGDPESRYALKHLKEVVMDDFDTFLTGAVDLAVEAEMLSHLHHPNIIKLEGVTSGSLQDAFSTGVVGGYFLVLERMDCTLSEQIQRWSKVKAGLKRFSRRRSLKKAGSMKMVLGAGSLSGVSHHIPTPISPDTESVSFDNNDPISLSSSRRLSVAADIAAGLAYLHKKNILFRDLKPQNIGIDFNGRGKIFDFGLAIELLPDGRKLTGNCGTRRYMAPEVARFEQYGLPADVYSFSLLLWEILSLVRPYSKLAAKDFPDNVYYGTMRPKISKKWPDSIKSLLPNSWDDLADKRPSMESIANTLQGLASAGPGLRPRHIGQPESISGSSYTASDTSYRSDRQGRHLSFSKQSTKLKRSFRRQASLSSLSSVGGQMSATCSASERSLDIDSNAEGSESSSSIGSKLFRARTITRRASTKFW